MQYIHTSLIPHATSHICINNHAMRICTMSSTQSHALHVFSQRHTRPTPTKPSICITLFLHFTLFAQENRGEFKMLKGRVVASHECTTFRTERLLFRSPWEISRLLPLQRDKGWSYIDPLAASWRALPRCNWLWAEGSRSHGGPRARKQIAMKYLRSEIKSEADKWGPN